jgi:transcriptional regulator GlxA family with amidase domain
MAATDAPVQASSGLRVSPTAGFIDPDELDYVVVVGGLLHRQRQIDRRICDYLLKVAQTRTALIGICTGSFVLCRLGLLQGKKCCISWFHYRDFIGEFDDLVPVADRLYVIDGNRITCPGGAGVIFLAADLVARHLGASTAQKVLHLQQIDRVRPGSSAQPAPPFEIASDDDRTSRAMLLMEQNLSRPLAIAKIAGNLGTSTRQLERIFRRTTGSAPHAVYLELRLKHARWMLRSSLSLTAIAADTGFADGAHFGRSFKAHFGMTPSEERRRLSEVALLRSDEAPREEYARRVF